MSTDNLTDLLNKVSAIVRSGASTYPILAQETGIPAKQVWDMMNLRRARPNGERALALHRWAEGMTIKISMGGRKLQTRYRDEYRAACKRFPVNGKD